MSKILTCAAALLISGLAASAQAKDLCAPTKTPVSEESVLKMLTEQGYTRIKKLEKEDGCFEGKGYDKSGVRAEIYIDPSNGQIVKVKGGQK